jgi:flagellar biosynthesis/type III secretory pathway chaperone
MIERALKAMTKIRDTLADIASSYNALSTLIDDEHSAITESSLDKLEVIVPAKMTIAGRIEAEITRLKQLCHEFYEASADVIPGTNEYQDLSANFSRMREYIEICTTKGIATADLHRVFDDLQSIFESFQSKREETTSKFEVNRLVVSRLLAHRQDNYRFWQEVTADMMAAYDKGGKQKANRKGSSLNIKA